MSYVNIRFNIRFNQSAYATKLFMFIEHFYADSHGLCLQELNRNSLQLFLLRGPALLDDLGKDFYGHTEIL